MAKPRDPDKVCGGKTPNGPCQQWAGAGTSHKGIGACKRHGGATPNHQVAAEKHMAVERMRTFGLPIDTDPQTALLDEIKRTAGHVAWLSSRIQNLDDSQAAYERATEGEEAESVPGVKEPLLDKTMFGPKPSVWIGIYQTERQHLARVCKMALDAGVAERQVALAEQQGQLLAEVIRGILSDLRLSPEQQQQAPVIVRKHLMAVPAA